MIQPNHRIAAWAGALTLGLASVAMAAPGNTEWPCQRGGRAPDDQALPCGFASDEWVRSGSGPWAR